MVIFHSYVKLPEGNSITPQPRRSRCSCLVGHGMFEAMQLRNALSRGCAVALLCRSCLFALRKETPRGQLQRNGHDTSKMTQQKELL